MLLACLSISARAEVHSETVAYQANKDKAELKGQLYWDDRYSGKLPGVILVHEWWGLNDYMKVRASQLASMGYIVMAVDMYGDGKQAEHPKQAGEWSSAVRGDPALARARFEAAIEQLSGHDKAADKPLAALGYCFGGSIVLDMAIQGVELGGVASFHGGLSGLSPFLDDIKTPVRVFHGEADTFISEDSLKAFQTGMQEHAGDYKLYSYADAVHGFTNPGADKIGVKGLGYSRLADSDSWARTLLFLSEISR